MKPYLLFAGNSYYPRGGVQDFIRDFPTAREAFDHYLQIKDQHEWGWWQVVEAATFKVVPVHQIF